MGLFDKFKKKDQKNNKTTRKIANTDKELTDEELDLVTATPRPQEDWCPKVDVTPTVTIPYSKNDPHRPIDRDR